MTRVCDCGNESCIDYLTDCFTLSYDPEFMEGKIIEFEEEFEQLDSLSQADVLKDWIELLQAKYENVTGDGFLQDLISPEEVMN